MAEKKQEEVVSIKKKELDRLLEMAEKYAESTETEEDDQEVEDIMSDLGELTPETDNSRWELDAHPIVLDVLRALRREVMMPNGQWRRPKGVEPMLNHKGQFDIASALSSFLSKDIALANIKEEEAHKFTVAVCKAIIKLIKYRWKQYDLEKPYFDHVLRIVEIKVYFHMTRPVGGGEKDYRKARMPIRENYSHDEVHPSELGYNNNAGGEFKV